jgi:nitroreductase
MTKVAKTDHPVHQFISKRWSPCGFEDRDVSKRDLLSLFEAARWAPSCYNEQPWRYIVARRVEPREFEKVLSCLVEPNQAWAKESPVLALGVTSLRFSNNDAPNRHAFHDLGLATANLSMEATARNLFVHQMAGILPDRARELFGIPEGFEAVTGFAIGYLAPDIDSLPPAIQERDRSPRTRRPLEETVFTGAWEKPSTLFE